VNQRILDAAANVSQEQFTAPGGVSHGSLRGTLEHALVAEVVWRERCQEGAYKTILSQSDFPDLESLRTYWAEDEKAMREYVWGLTDDDLAGTITYSRTEGQVLETPLWQILLHVIIHGTQSRSEAAVLLTQLGHSPGDLDYNVYLR
jgi:uncharacterized damage-inducible protein DinB